MIKYSFKIGELQLGILIIQSPLIELKTPLSASRYFSTFYRVIFGILRRSKIVIQIPKIIILCRVMAHSKVNSLGNCIKK